MAIRTCPGAFRTGGRLPEELVERSRVPDECPELADLAVSDPEELDPVLIEDFVAPNMVIVDEHRHEVVAGHHLADVDREVGRAANPRLAEEPHHLLQTILVAC